MNLQERINAFVTLGKFLGQFSDPFDTATEVDTEIVEAQEAIPFFEIFYDGMLQQLELAGNHNGWFTSENLQFTCNSWSEALSEENLQKWVAAYDFSASEASEKTKTIAIIMAGNIPMVGFHDFLSVLISGHKVLAKLSSKDNQLLPYLAKYLVEIEPKFEPYISFTKEKLENFDAVIATGSDNSSRYFDYYFGKYPHIIRKNRNSVAVLTGKETPQQMEALADDIFRYFGLGCRNVSKIYLPKGYEMDRFFNGMFSWKEMINNNKYINNYDYNKAVYLMSGFDLLDNEFLLLKESEDHSSPISVIYYEYYNDLSELKIKLEAEKEKIQLIVANAGLNKEIPFGKAQQPELWDYADGIDTLQFLVNITSE
ncbi:acyl-CoA reductase [Ulvibacter antarcticus]|uniref:Acyl-CoA reductase LuxC n=1 Tax=Ulvibacter antarcticus TaxID=442714 RepID=A0A3L9YVZ8_9FLAO|nr:acyl-CoA reductase [Ulvibacter antarcticus]RMA64494.1 acyl-CoA reductase LuxC [Ulvibacter antarcticus]